MNNIEELKKAALGANLHGWTGFEDALNADGYSEAVSKFIGHCSPSEILTLIAQLEAAQKLNPLLVNVSELEATYIGDIRLHMAAISDWKLRAETAEAALSAANNGVTAENLRVIKMLLDVCGTAFELADDSCQQDVDGELCHVVPDSAFSRLSDALGEIENTLPDEYEDLPNIVLQWAAIPRHALQELFSAAPQPAGFTVKEDATPIVIVPAPAGVIMRPPFKKPLEHCAAARDGECSHQDCPQLRDNEPMATGRHCPIDDWDD